MFGKAVIAAAVLVLLFIHSAAAQSERYELGRRLREFERAWDAADAAGRKRSVDPLERAVGAFFSFRLGEAGKALDEARFAARSDEAATAERLWATSLFVRPESRLIDADEVPLAIDAFYKTERPEIEAAIEVSVFDDGGKQLCSQRLDLDALPAEARLNLDGVPPGDHELRWRVLRGEDTLAEGRIGLSRVHDAQSRLAALRKIASGWERNEDDLDRASVRGLLDSLDSLWDKETLETDLPAARLSAEAEAAVESIAAGRPYYTADRPGSFWLRAPVSRSGSPLRVFVPEVASAESPLPLVVALHGAGGSENMFFDGYGDGAIVRLCRERGWMLVATRGGFFGAPPVVAIVDELAKRYHIDAKRVFLVGHSMGAQQAARIASESPQGIAGVAALGGGGSVRRSEDLQRLPFFIAAGSRDFGLRGAKSLHAALRRAGVEQAEFREYPDVEHLVIVQAALPDVFGFFDETASDK